jgi:hypothetical protein
MLKRIWNIEICDLERRNLWSEREQDIQYKYDRFVSKCTICAYVFAEDGYLVVILSEGSLCYTMNHIRMNHYLLNDWFYLPTISPNLLKVFESLFQTCFKLASNFLTTCFKLSHDLLKLASHLLHTCFKLTLQLLQTYFTIASNLLYNCFKLTLQLLQTCFTLASNFLITFS